jgi:DNA-binding MarR family transcriptional regulator
MTNRQTIIKNLMENMGAAMRLMSKSPQAKGMPTKAQAGVLIMIAHLGVQNTKDLALRMGMTPSAVTQLVDGLAREKLIARNADQKDRRIVWLKLTLAGRKQLSIFEKQRMKFFLKMVKPLSDKDLQQLNRIQDKIIKGLNNA